MWASCSRQEVTFHQNKSMSTRYRKRRNNHGSSQGSAFIVLCLILFYFWKEILGFAIFCGLVYALGWSLCHFHREIWQVICLACSWAKSRFIGLGGKMKNQGRTASPQVVSHALPYSNVIDVTPGTGEYSESSTYYGKIRQ